MHFGSFAAVGIASLGGALFGRSNFGLREKIEEGLGAPWASLPVGVLFVVLGMGVSLKEVGAHTILGGVVFATVAAARLISCWISIRKVNESSNERFLVMLGALAPGEMGVLIAAYLFSRGLLNPSHFNISIIVVVMLTMTTPALMKIVHESKIYSPERTKFSPSPFDGRRGG